jgi:hypothetical protein
MPNYAITLSEAVQMTRDFRQNKEGILKTEFQNKGVLPVCETFDKEAIQQLLDQAGCEKLRLYLGMDGNNLVKLILVSVDDNDRDMLPANDTQTEPAIFENGVRCPQMCPPSSVLNS